MSIGNLKVGVLEVSEVVKTVLDLPKRAASEQEAVGKYSDKCPSEELPTKYSNEEISNINGVVFIPVCGVLLEKCRHWHEYYGVMSLQKLESNLLFYGRDPAVKAIVLDFNTPGGSGYCKQIYDVIQIVRQWKLVIGVVEKALSAGYWIASGCDYLITRNKLSKVGCVGTVWVHFDYSGSYADDNIVVSVVTSEGREVKKDGNRYEPLRPEVRARILEQFKKEDVYFDNDIKAGRSGVDDLIFKGGSFISDDALAMRAIDSIASDEPGQHYMSVVQTYIDENSESSIQDTSLLNSTYNVIIKQDMKVLKQFKPASSKEDFDKVIAEPTKHYVISEEDALKITTDTQKSQNVEAGIVKQFKIHKENLATIASMELEKTALNEQLEALQAKSDGYQKKLVDNGLLKSAAVGEEENDDEDQGGAGGAEASRSAEGGAGGGNLDKDEAKKEALKKEMNGESGMTDLQKTAMEFYADLGEDDSK